MVWKAVASSPLLYRFLFLILVLIASLLVESMDHGKRPWEESPEAGRPPLHLRAYLRGQG